jgi:mono/diheme cytochrome c family protein
MTHRLLTRWALLSALAATAMSAAQADSKGPVVAPLPVYQQECAACHIAYPPGLLPAASWHHMMGSLNQHFGTDASLDEASRRQISTWLQAHAGTYKRVVEPPPQDRITKAAWFERKHRQIDASTWALPSVKSPANCAACHTRAEQGQFGDSGLQFPAGLDPRQRRHWSD